MRHPGTVGRGTRAFGRRGCVATSGSADPKAARRAWLLRSQQVMHAHWLVITGTLFYAVAFAARYWALFLRLRGKPLDNAYP